MKTLFFHNQNKKVNLFSKFRPTYFKPPFCDWQLWEKVNQGSVHIALQVIPRTPNHNFYLIRSSVWGIPSSFSIKSRSCWKVVSMASVNMLCFPSDVDSRTFFSVRFTTGWVSFPLAGLVCWADCWGLTLVCIHARVSYSSVMLLLIGIQHFL